MVKKNTKRALLMSVLSLLLCCSMLIGTTFAWFTDTVESGINKITAGNLDVEVYYGKEETPKTNKVEKNTENLFTDANGEEVLWEPGVVAYTNLNVVNEGSLALKYQFAINFDNENYILGTDAKLSEVLKVAFLENPVSGSREEILNAAKGQGVNLENLMKTGTLLAETNKVYGVVIYWEPSDLDNTWNVQNGAQTNDNKPLHIDLGIKLVATQLNAEAEKDSFNQDYDENAWHPDMVVYNAADLKAGLANGGKIQLAADVVVPETIEVPEGVSVELNLNGKKITGATSRSMVVNNGALTIKGGTVENTAENGGAVIYNKGVMTIDDLTVIGAPISTVSGNPAYPINNYGTMTVEDGTHISSDRGAMYLGGNGETTINGGTFVFNDVSDKIDRAYTSHVIAVGYGANNKLTINGGTFAQNFVKNSGGVVVCNMSATTVTVNGGNFSGGNYFGKWDNLSDYGYGMTKTPFSVTGGTFTGMDNNYVAEGYKTINNGDGTWTVAKGDVVVTTSDELIAAINAADDGEIILLAAGDYALRFTNNTAFNVDNLTLTGVGKVNLAVSSSEVWYGRVQGDNVTFENIIFTSSVGATGQATYNNCTFNGDWAICASSNKDETYFNKCTINGCLNTSVDFSAGDTFVKDSTIAKAEFSGTATMNFENCTIGELISWNMNTTLNNCKVTTLDKSHMTTAALIIDGYEQITAANATKPVAPLEEDFLFPAGTNAVLFENVLLTGDAQIVHTENAVLGLSNVKAELDHDVIIRKSGGAICISDCEFTLTNGAKLISVGEGGGADQVFLINVKVNGELLTDANARQYLEGIGWFGAYPEWPNEG